MSKQVVITGMHRSGTSLVASLIQKAGVDIGDRLQGASRGNLRGHFEDSDFYRFHEKMLKRRGQSVFVQTPDYLTGINDQEVIEARTIVERRMDKAIWGWKDPRTCLFLDFWYDLLPDPYFLFLYRHPIEVTLSLLRRGTDMEVLLDPWVAIRAWQLYNQNMLRFHQAHPQKCLMCHISGITKDSGAFASLLTRTLDLPLQAEALQSLYHPDELKQGMISPDVEVVMWNIAPETMELYVQLEAQADLAGDQKNTLTELQSSQVSAIKKATSAFKNSDQNPGYLLHLLLQALDPDAAIEASLMSKETFNTLQARIAEQEHTAKHSLFDIAGREGTILTTNLEGLEHKGESHNFQAEVIRSKYDDAPQTSIIIVTYNTLEYTRLCLQSIYAKTVEPSFEVIIVDNASKDGTREFLKVFATTHRNVQLILNAANEGFAHANNFGAAAASGEYLVFLNNDTIVTPNWLSRLIHHLQDPQVGMVGPVTNSANNESRIEVAYQIPSEIDHFAEQYTQRHLGTTFDIPVLAFFCVAMRRALFEEVGPLDDRFGLGTFEDDDYAMRVKLLGYRIICAEDVFVHHWGGASFAQLDQSQYWKLARDNRRKFEAKWKTKWVPHRYRAELMSQQVGDLAETNFELLAQAAENQQMIADLQAEIDQLRNTIEHVQAQLNIVRYSKSYRLVRLLQTFKREFIDGSISEKSIFLRRGLARLHMTGPPAVQLPPDSIDYVNSILQSVISSPATVQSNAAVLGELAETPADVSQVRSPRKLDRVTTARKPTVAYLTNQLFDWHTQALRYGGGERYCRMLGTLLTDLGYEVTFYQPSHQQFVQDYHGFTVKSLPMGEAFSEFYYGVANQFYDISLDYDRVIYNLPEYSSGKMRDDAITICHGIWFDHNNYSYAAFRTREWFEHLYRAFSQPQRVVSVDTNSINVVRALWPALASRMVYIPNNVDTKLFKPSPHKRSESTVTVIFPRRSQINRGSRILADILGDVPHDCRFIWVGEGDAEDTDLIKSLAKRDDRLSYLAASFDDMPDMYQKSDICVIPTIACEGTSLSCLEGLASGCATIATNVGGLSDLVQPGVNGLLVEPTAQDIAVAINFLFDNPLERERLQRAGPEWAAHFSIEKWRNRWIRLLIQLGWIDPSGLNVPINAEAMIQES